MKSVHTGCKQHQRVCTQICMQICSRVLCEWGHKTVTSRVVSVRHCGIGSQFLPSTHNNYPKWFWVRVLLQTKNTGQLYQNGNSRVILFLIVLFIFLDRECFLAKNVSQLTAHCNLTAVYSTNLHNSRPMRKSKTPKCKGTAAASFKKFSHLVFCRLGSQELKQKTGSLKQFFFLRGNDALWTRVFVKISCNVC